MCGRYAFTHSTADLQALFQVVNPDGFQDAQRFNIAPTQLVPIVFGDRQGERRAGQARWGLVPGWVKDPSEWKASTFNARSEDAAGKPTFRNAFRKGRVLVPASGFFEWKKDGSRKRPFYIHDREGAPLAFAGLMDIWRSKEGDDRLVSSTILTTASREPLTELHHRMPVMVRPEKFDEWLFSDDPQEALDDVLAAMPLDGIDVYEVTPEVNNARQDDPSFVQPLS